MIYAFSTSEIEVFQRNLSSTVCCGALLQDSVTGVFTIQGIPRSHTIHSSFEHYSEIVTKQHFMLKPTPLLMRDACQISVHNL